MSTALFDGEAFKVKSSEPQPELSADRRRTLKRQELLAKGVHPATRAKIREGSETCGDCVNAVKHDRWWKCKRVGITFGAGTDIRVSWPACTKFEPATTSPSSNTKGEE